jgi:hypothetical protein
VPVPPHVLTGMSAPMVGRARDAIVFTAPQSGSVTDEHFRDRVWLPGGDGRVNYRSRMGSQAVCRLCLAVSARYR